MCVSVISNETSESIYRVFGIWLLCCEVLATMCACREFKEQSVMNIKLPLIVCVNQQGTLHVRAEISVLQYDILSISSFLHPRISDTFPSKKFTVPSLRVYPDRGTLLTMTPCV